jgi:excisionase family DNA binding protein
MALVDRMEKGEANKTEGGSESTKVLPSGGYVSAEEAGASLGIHVQTLRGYIHSGKLPPQRLAGERAIRIRREDLAQLRVPV